MSTPLVTAIRESCGYLQDEGWHQTAKLMTHAADEIERLTNRVQELEGGAEPAAAPEKRAWTPWIVADRQADHVISAARRSRT